MVLGVVILIVLSVFVYNYFKTNKNDGQVTNGASTENSSVRHKVVKGETLWKIAENYYKTGLNWKKIAEANNITNPGSIEVGQELTIPEVAVAKADTTTVNLGKSENETTPSIEASITPTVIKGATYKVIKGDSLWKIAVRAYGDGYKWVTIANENKLQNPNIIYPDNVLILPR